jgi:uncharacterized membrane protein
MADLDKLKQQIEELRRQYTELTKKPAALFETKNIKEASSAVETLNRSIEQAKKQALELEEGFGGIDAAIKEIVNELKRGNTASDLTIKAFRGIRGITEKLKYDQQDISELNLKQLRQQKDKLKSLQQEVRDQAKIISEKVQGLTLDKNGDQLQGAALKARLKRLEIDGKINAQELAILEGAKEGFSIFEETNKLLDERIEKEKKLNQQLGITGAALKGISKIPMLGDLLDTTDALDAAREKLKETGNPVKALGSAFKNIGGQITGGILNPANLLLGTITLIAKTLFEVDKSAGDYAKSMNVTYTEAVQLRGELAQMALESGDVALNSKALQDTLGAVGQSLGSNAKLNEKDLQTFTKLREQAGFTNEELMGVQKLSLVNGKSLEKNTKEILGGAKAYASRKGLVVNEKQILKDISKSSASLQLSLGGSAKELARSAVQARQFGISLEQAEKMSQSLLDFESSIESELSAELLTGKDLNLERARGLALNGDAAAAAAEIASQVGSAAEFGKMNVIQQESIAKAVGMTRDELAQSLIDREALAKLGAKEGQSAQDRYNELKAQGMSEAEIAKKLGDEELAKQYEQQSVQEQFNQQIEHMKEMFVEMAPAILSIAQGLMEAFGIVGMILTPIQAIFGFFGKIGASISKLLGPLGAVGKVIKGIASIAVIYAAYQAYASLATIPIAGVALGLAASAGILAAGFGLIGSIKDGAIDPKGGLIVSGEKGSIQLDPKDSIIAGTDLVPKDMHDGAIDPKGKVVASGARGSMGGDMSAVIAAINSLASRPINVSIDGKKVIEATTGANPNTAGDENRKNSYKMS